MRWRQPIRTLPRRVGQSAAALGRLLYQHPVYILIAALGSVVFYELIFWFLNLGLLQYVVTSTDLSLGAKLDIFVGSYTGIISPPFVPLSVLLFTVSALQGLTLAGLIYTIRAARRANKGIVQGVGATGVAGLLSVFGLGCAACGTSLVTPILTFFFASSSTALAETVGVYAATLALVAAVVAAYLTGYRLSAVLK